MRAYEGTSNDDYLSIQNSRLWPERALCQVPPRGQPARTDPAQVSRKGFKTMTAGKVTKLVRTFGSTWGRIQPDGETREVFFNAASLVVASGYADLEIGQEVEFEEERDLANGTRAIHIRTVAVPTEA